MQFSLTQWKRKRYIVGWRERSFVHIHCDLGVWFASESGFHISKKCLITRVTYIKNNVLMAAHVMVQFTCSPSGFFYKKKLEGMMDYLIYLKRGSLYLLVHKLCFTNIIFEYYFRLVLYLATKLALS